MRTRIITGTLLTGSLLLASASSFAQKPAATAVIATPTSMPAATAGQTITVRSVQYVVNSVKKLATGVEYYVLAPKIVSRATPPAPYVRSKGIYNPTVFTLVQYENFVKTGKISSFGTLATKTVGKRKVTYVTNGTKKALFVTKGKTLTVCEFEGDVAVFMEKGASGETSPQRAACGQGCSNQLSECDALVLDPPDPNQSNACFDEFIICVAACDDAYPSNKRTSVSVLNTAIPITL